MELVKASEYLLMQTEKSRRIASCVDWNLTIGLLVASVDDYLFRGGELASVILSVGIVRIGGYGFNCGNIGMVNSLNPVPPWNFLFLPVRIERSFKCSDRLKDACRDSILLSIRGFTSCT